MIVSTFDDGYLYIILPDLLCYSALGINLWVIDSYWLKVLSFVRLYYHKTWWNMIVIF